MIINLPEIFGDTGGDMQAVTGIFPSQTDAEQAVRKLQATGLPADRVTLLTLGLLGSAVLNPAGATVGACPQLVGKSCGPDALRRGRSVVIALAEDDAATAALRKSLQAEGAEAIDAAREQWWAGARSAEQERHLRPGLQFGDDEKFSLLGFEAALHARNRCKEFDRVASEMARAMEGLQQQFPGVAVEEPFARGYQRGRGILPAPVR